MPGNRPTPEAMDLHNNSVGIRIAQQNPNASNAELATLITNAVRAGEMLVIDRDGKLAWSDHVRVGQHGLAPTDEAALDGRRPVPQTVAPQYGALTHPAGTPTPEVQLASASTRLADDPALNRYLVALLNKSDEQNAINDAARALTQSPLATEMLRQAKEQHTALERHQPVTTEPTPPSLQPARQGPSLA